MRAEASVGRNHTTYLRGDALRLRVGLFALLLAAFLCGASPTGQVPSAEQQLKAAFVSKFPQFTEWPESTLNGRQQIELCVAIPNPFGTSLRELTEGERLGSRPLVVRTVDSPGDLDGCQLLFLPTGPPGERKILLDRARTRPILTVGDAPTFIEEGGMVALRMVDGRVRFEINVDAANQVGLRLSSQLLRLALSVRGGSA
jgi:hypothetical protein